MQILICPFRQTIPAVDGVPLFLPFACPILVPGLELEFCMNDLFVYFVRNYRLRNQAGQFNMIPNFSPFFFCNIHPFLINHIS